MPIVSFVVPVYNVMQYLEQCVESLLEQTERDIEIILVDDGSTDGSGAFCDDCAAKDSRVTVIHQQNAGPSKTRNAGIEAARSEWISFVDSDDWIDPETVLEMEGFLSPESDLTVYSYCRNIDGKDVSVFNSSEGAAFSPEVSRDYLAGACFLNQEFQSGIFPESMADGPALTIPFGKFYRKSIIMQNDIRFNENVSYSEDKLFNYDYLLAVKGTVCFVNKPFYHYRTREGSIVRSSASGLCERYSNLMDAYSGIAASLFPGRFSEKCFYINIVHNMNTLINRSLRSRETGRIEIYKRIGGLLHRPIVTQSVREVSIADFNGALAKMATIVLKIIIA